MDVLYMLPVCMYIYDHMCTVPVEVSSPLELQLCMVCELPCAYWELSSGPHQEEMLLTAESPSIPPPSSHPHFLDRSLGWCRICYVDLTNFEHIKIEHLLSARVKRLPSYLLGVSFYHLFQNSALKKCGKLMKFYLIVLDHSWSW